MFSHISDTFLYSELFRKISCRGKRGGGHAAQSPHLSENHTEAREGRHWLEVTQPRPQDASCHSSLSLASPTLAQVNLDSCVSLLIAAHSPHVHACTHTYMCTHTRARSPPHAHTHTYTHALTHTHTHAWVHTHTCSPSHAHIHTHTRSPSHAHIHTCLLYTSDAADE